MAQIKWFERKFDFSYEQNIFPSIIERLEGTPLRLNNKINKITTDHLVVKPDGKWSIQENIGHLIDLEPLWQGRLEDILEQKEYLREADLSNRKTHEADHNEKEIHTILAKFGELRNATVEKLKTLDPETIYQAAIHPRLNKPMRTMDLFLFVAEHDDHHLARITEINSTLQKS